MDAPLQPGGESLLVAALVAELRTEARPHQPLDARTATRLHGAAGGAEPLAALQARRRCGVAALRPGG